VCCRQTEREITEINYIQFTCSDPAPTLISSTKKARNVDELEKFSELKKEVTEFVQFIIFKFRRDQANIQNRILK
jgi:hypothetical protein